MMSKQSSEVTGFVYMTTCKINNKKYIGKCRYDRINDHRKYLGSGVELKKDIKKYGKENFYRTILAEVQGDRLLEEVEENFIKEYKAVESDEFYNLKLASIGGDTITYSPNKQNRVRAISKRVTGKGNPMFNKPKSENFFNAIKEKNSRRVMMYGKEYSSVTEAAKDFDKSQSTLLNRLNDDAYPEIHYLDPPKKKKTTNMIRAYEHNGLHIEGTIFKNMNEAKKQLHMNPVNIKKRLLDPEFKEWYYLMK